MAAKFTELEIRTMFSILDIDPTKDENAIRDAYRKRLPFTNPEDDPTAFMQLRGAYERALVYAKTEDEEPKAPAIYDDTPAGQWVHKADDIYRSFANRVNPECWEELFHDDYFQSLDGEQECIDRMLVFMTRHFYYPTAVWKVFDKYLGITANTAAIREKIPAPFVNMLVSKCRNGEQIGDKYTCTYGCPVNQDGYGICSKTMMMLYPLMEAVRSGGDLENLGGNGKYEKTIVCPDGCVVFKLTAKPLGNENFHKGGFWEYPDQTV